MIKLPKLSKTGALSLLVTVLLASFQVATLVVQARSSDQVEAEIAAQKNQLSGVNAQIVAAQTELTAASSQLGGASSQVAQLQAQINETQANIKLNQLKLEALLGEKQLNTLEQKAIELSRGELLRSAYTNWRSDRELNATGLGWVGKGLAAGIKLDAYRSSLLETANRDLSSVNEKLSDIGRNIENVNQLSAELEKQNRDLAARKAQLDEEIAAIRRNVSSRSSAVAGLRTQSSAMQQKINQLSSEQKALQEYENQLLQQAGNGGGQTVASGQYYLFGTGRDLYQGHGVGMSQYGAHGAAQKGWNASRILEFYYTGTRVTNYDENSNITVKYCANNPALDPYQKNGCDDGQQPVTERVSMDEYLAGLGEMPESWPVEARKAQMIAARTYALRSTNNGDPNVPICLTTYCQVTYFKTGDTREMDLVLATKGLVVTYNGKLIETLYSADNSQGKGTANNDTVFSTMSGDGTAYPYLRAVNDTGVASTTSYTKWQWRSDGFDMTRLDRFLNHGASFSKLSGSARSFMTGLKSAVGGRVAYLGFERDPSNRVKKVIITGTNGQSRAMAGWLFKTVWNSWVSTERPNGSVDYIYSLTFFLAKAD